MRIKTKTGLLRDVEIVQVSFNLYPWRANERIVISDPIDALRNTNGVINFFQKDKFTLNGYASFNVYGFGSCATTDLHPNYFSEMSVEIIVGEVRKARLILKDPNYIKNVWLGKSQIEKPVPNDWRDVVAQFSGALFTIPPLQEFRFEFTCPKNYPRDLDWSVWLSGALIKPVN